MDIAFIIIAALTFVSALAAISLCNLVHCALSVAVTFVGLALLYLKLGAEFVGFAQIVVYVGAVAILIVFAILLTKSSETSNEPRYSRGAIWSGVVAAVAFAGLVAAISASQVSLTSSPVAPSASVEKIGQDLMSKYVLPLEAIGLLLTAALIGAVIIAMKEKPAEGDEQ